MSKYLYLVTFALFLVACNELDEIEKRLDNLESSKEKNEPILHSVKFLAQDNPYQIIQDISCDIIGDSIVECRIPNITPNKMLFPVISYTGDSIYVNEERYGLIEYANVEGRIDFQKPVKIVIYSNGVSKEYTVYVHSFNGLPVLWIETDGRKDVLTKDYQDAKVKLVEDIITYGASNVIVDEDAQIKCRGNSSFQHTDKKSFTLKYKNKVSLFGEAKDKSYVLIANSFDKTMLRTTVAFSLSRLSCLEYTPSSHFVDLILNGQYHGTYLLSDKIKISKDRVNVGDDGFVLEVDERAPRENEPYFRTAHLPQPVNVKDPDVVVGDDNYNYVADYVNYIDSVLFSDGYLDEENGWTKYMDIDSFVDWYLIEEIAKNGDARMYTSCFMNLKRNGKLKMGPVWDFDVTFGNNRYYAETEGILINQSEWYRRLFEDPTFEAKVKKRFSHFYAHVEDILNDINQMAQYIQYSVIENDNRWHMLNETWFSSYDIWGKYENEVTNFKIWFVNRMEWLKIYYGE